MAWRIRNTKNPELWWSLTECTCGRDCDDMGDWDDQHASRWTTKGVIDLPPDGEWVEESDLANVLDRLAAPSPNSETADSTISETAPAVWKIRNVYTIPETLHWSNLDGWVSGDDYDLFAADAKEYMRLPADGVWVPEDPAKVRSRDLANSGDGDSAISTGEPGPWVSPTGSLIVGTLERLTGIARIIEITDDGEPEYEGTTDVLWDEQKTLTRHGKSLFVDEAGETWTFDRLTRGTF